jgi:GH43 family beta-xylosidase
MIKMISVFFWLLVILSSCKENNNPSPLPQEQEGKFKNPVLTSAPDPWVFKKDDWYYVTHTTGNNLRLYRTQKMSELDQASVQTVWTPPASGPNSKNIWAPEIHHLNNKWYFYYAADNGANENHRMWVLENSSEDPFLGTWIEKGEVELPDDRWAIDGTAFEVNGQLYFAWSGWEGTTNIRQDIYLTKMTNPWTAEGERLLLSKPELPWELAGGSPSVNEAPQFLSHGSKIFITYSASGCWTDEYKIGLLSADIDADLMTVSSWSKHDQPLFVKSPSAQAYGPGHNSFFKSRDGSEDWITYHANAASNLGCGNARSMRMQKFTWRTDGLPDFGDPVAVGALVEIPSGEN